MEFLIGFCFDWNKTNQRRRLELTIRFLFQLNGRADQMIEKKGNINGMFGGLNSKQIRLTTFNDALLHWFWKALIVFFIHWMSLEATIEMDNVYGYACKMFRINIWVPQFQVISVLYRFEFIAVEPSVRSQFIWTSCPFASILLFISPHHPRKKTPEVSQTHKHCTQEMIQTTLEERKKKNMCKKHIKNGTQNK